jgi:hypothetical protein
LHVSQVQLRSDDGLMSSRSSVLQPKHFKGGPDCLRPERRRNRGESVNSWMRRPWLLWSTLIFATLVAFGAVIPFGKTCSEADLAIRGASTGSGSRMTR